MGKKTVLSISENKGFAPPKVEIEELDTVISVRINRKKKYVKRIMKLCRGHDIILSKKCDGEEFFEKIKIKWEAFSPELVVPVINEICRQVSLKFHCSIPFEEIYIVAKQKFALSIIEKIKNFAHLFIVVSQEDTDIKLYDKLYFDCSAMAHHSRIIPPAIKEDSMIICFEEASLPNGCQSPLINFTNKEVGLSNEVNGRRICVSDMCIKQIKELWDGNSGFSMFELTGEKTGHNSTVDINNYADNIFLLDIAAF